VQNIATDPRIDSAAFATETAQPESSRYGVGSWHDDSVPLQSDIREINRLDGSSLVPAGLAPAADAAVGDSSGDASAAQECEFLHASEYQQQPGWHLQARSHSHHELLVVREGTLRCKVQGQILTLQVGQSLLVPPTVVHEEWTEGNGVRLLSVGFRWSNYRPGMPLEIKDEKGRLGELTEWLWSERHARFQDAGAFRQQLLRSLVCEYLRLSEQSGWQPQELDPQNPIVHNVSKFIREHMSEHFTLDDLAAQAKMSKFYFARAYRTLTGLSPMDHARLIRLEAARELLLTTNLPLKSIAPKVGFASEFHLSRLLRARLGVGARQIRARAAG
jgi:AraC-like DNA-binding protein/mannose-6-phosphate isomerase-like protein (cupin superfamily)